MKIRKIGALAILASAVATCFSQPAFAGIAFSVGDQKVDQGVAGSASGAWPVTAENSTASAVPVYQGGWKYLSATSTFATVSASALGCLIINTGVSGATVKLYDGASDSVTAISVDAGTSSERVYDMALTSGYLGIRATGSTAPDVVVTYR